MIAMTRGRPAGLASSRNSGPRNWNRSAVTAKPSRQDSDQDEDGHFGGGAFLITPDTPTFPGRSNISDNMDEHQQRQGSTLSSSVSSKLKGDARPFVPDFHLASAATTPNSFESSFTQSSTSMSDSQHSSGTEATAITVLPPAMQTQVASPHHTQSVTTNDLLNLYFLSKQRSATLSSQKTEETLENSAGSSDHVHRGYHAGSIAPSAPIGTGFQATPFAAQPSNINGTSEPVQHNTPTAHTPSQKVPSTVTRSSAGRLGHTRTTSHRDVLLPMMLARANGSDSTHLSPEATGNMQGRPTVPGTMYPRTQNQGSASSINGTPTSMMRSSANHHNGAVIESFTPTRGGQGVSHSLGQHQQASTSYAANQQQALSQDKLNGSVTTPGNRAAENHYVRQHQQQAISNGIGHFAVDGQVYRQFNSHNSSPTRVPASSGLPHSSSDGSIEYSTALAVVPDGAFLDPMHFEVPSMEVLRYRSNELRALTENGRPNVDDVVSSVYLPFEECYKGSSPDDDNSVIIIKNIPYETTRSELIALLGQGSKLLNDNKEPVHIIMDRVTSKTLDAFVEVESLTAAVEIVQRFDTNMALGRPGKLRSRVVHVEMSSPAQLMQALFPSTMSGVDWVGATPTIKTGSKFSHENFKAFFTEEQMIMLSKHAITPQRSSFAQGCPERPYECMISTLRKIPWHMSAHITIKQRDSVYKACMAMIQCLQEEIAPSMYANNHGKGKRVGNNRLSQQLLDRLVVSAMLCYGFSVVQKHNIAELVGLPEQKAREFNLPRFPSSWRHQWTLAPKPGMPIDVLEWYIAVIRAETNRVVQSLPIPDRNKLEDMARKTDPYWGYFWAQVNFPVGQDFDNMTLSDCSCIEWEAIQKILERAIQGGRIGNGFMDVKLTPNRQTTRNHY